MRVCVHVVCVCSVDNVYGRLFCWFEIELCIMCSTWYMNVYSHLFVHAHVHVVVIEIRINMFHVLLF